MMRQFGLFGGSFNPIHNGHLHLAEAVWQALSLEGVLLMPTGEAPHKSSAEYAAAAHRLAMCRLAAQDYPWMRVSDYEIRKGGRSYTIDTLTYLRERHPDIAWTLMIGSDMLLSFDTWRRWQDILANARLCVVSREQGDLIQLREKAEQLKQNAGNAAIEVLLTEPLAVSSTELRGKIRKNEEQTCLLPENVVQYIQENALYGAQPERKQE